MNIRMIKAALAGLVLSVSSFANAGLIFSNVSFDSSSITFTVEGDLTGYSSPSQLQGFGIEYYGDIWAGVNATSQNSWSSEVFDSFSFDHQGYTGVWNGFNNNEPYSWSQYIGDLTGATVSNKTITLTLGNNYLNTSALDPQFDIIWGWAGDQQSNTVLYSYAAEVPEPSTLAIFALGIMGLAARRAKK